MLWNETIEKSWKLTPEDFFFGASEEVPDPDRAVVGAGGKLLVGGREGDASDGFLVGLQRRNIVNILAGRQ